MRIVRNACQANAESRSACVFLNRRPDAWLVAAAACGALCGIVIRSASAVEPRVLVPGFELEQIAAAPDVVTPIGVALDDRGDLLVIESHTHQTPPDYVGPTHDRIRRLIDENGDGVVDRVTTFLDGLHHTMSILSGDRGWMYVATRRAIMRIRDTDGDGSADQQQQLVQLETAGDYPHNGLAGLTFDPHGRLVFGMGENLGERYSLVGSDGSQIHGGGEGGNIFRCHPDGSMLERIATGFWNPFGNVFDPAGRLFCVDNDPDASPPCRLLHVVESGDFGYQFRFGRSGRHPLQAWDAEMPGTLPMAAGTGEAPCQVLVYRGRLWVSSWGDYRLEAYELKTVGAMCQAKQQVIVQGDRQFRPVGMALGPDGSLVFADWVDRSYPVHGQGRVWRLKPTQQASGDRAYVIPARSAAEQRAGQLRAQPTVLALDDDDPYIRQAAVQGLAKHAEPMTPMEWSQLASSRQRLGWLQAVRWRSKTDVRQFLKSALNDPNEDVRMYAMRIVAEQDLQIFRSELENRLATPLGQSERLLRVTLATLGWLESGAESKDSTLLNMRLAEQLRESNSNPSIRRLALRVLPDSDEAVAVEHLDKLFKESPELRGEIIACLSDRGSSDRPLALAMLTRIAQDSAVADMLRCDAAAALASFLPESRETLKTLIVDAVPSVSLEAKRGLRDITPLSLRAAPDVSKFDLSSFGSGDVEAGRRVFFRAQGGRCSACHAHSGRGGSVGPDLTIIDRRATPEWLLQTILDPSRDVAPRYSSVTVVTHDGQSVTGLALAGPGDDDQETIVQSDGTHVPIPFDQIEQRIPNSLSVMPTGMDAVLSKAELEDVIAFLSSSDR